MATLASVSPVPLNTSVGGVRRARSRLSAHNTSLRQNIARTSIEVSNASLRRSLIRGADDDSSDDEDLAPIKLSAEAQAILGDDQSNLGSDKENLVPDGGEKLDAKASAVGKGPRSWVSARQSPSREDGSPAPRVVRVTATRPSPRATLARDGSFMYKIHEKHQTPAPENGSSQTPAPQLRQVRSSVSRGQTVSPPYAAERQDSVVEQCRDENDYQSPQEQSGDNNREEEVSHGGPSTVMRSRRGDEGGIHSTMRVRRIGTGTLLNGPIRRGMIRRHSDDDEVQARQREEQSPSPEIEQGRRAAEPDLEDLPDNMPISYGSPKQLSRFDNPQQHQHQQPRRASPAQFDNARRQSPPRSNVLSTSLGNSGRSNPASVSERSAPSSKTSGSNPRPAFKLSSVPLLESAHDQENEPPPTFKRSKPSNSILEIPSYKQVPGSEPHAQQQLPSSTASPSRQPLAPRSDNTPHRPPPVPPPKMSLIEAATSNAGNARAKKSVHYVLNGRTYRRLDVIGRGGSSRVFRIMAENYKIFALKRVNLEEADMAAIAGYKGEIDLLRKLENVDRVIRLFDYEINEDKGVLSVMMELGESDFNKMLNEQLKAENARFDVTFTRHYWKEMLCCVQAVHQHGIVHSDLKPANFLLVKGQLKLIDFGIANAIQDNTVNVHRENQIGTPNYMSPESLVCHAPAAGQAAGTKLLKLGKPSDVWSLGCILYQMTYGQPPFAHITKQFERIMSIPNPKVEIQFSTTGIGGAVVPFGLIKTLRRCLQREQSLRPTIEELLSDSDPFLNPVAISPDMLGRVIGNVVTHFRKKEETMRAEGRLGIEGQSVIPRDEEMRGWPVAFYDKLRQAQEEGSAW